MGEIGRVETRSVTLFSAERPLALDSGSMLAPVEVAYETYGTLDADRANAIYVLHALTGDAHAAGHHGDPARRGWWDTIIGPGRPLDTERFYVVCANLLGGCQGTTGPSSPDPAGGGAYGLRFPHFTVRDLVRVHRALARHLGIARPLAAIGGSLGGMQALQWALDAPGELGAAVVLCASSLLSAQNIAFSAVARSAIMGDPDFRGGDYARHGVRPDHGLAVARMMAHITYLSEESMRRKFDRRRQDGAAPGGFGDDFQVEGYLRYQGESFLRRFDANSYLYLSRVMDHFDPFADMDAVRAALMGAATRFLVLSFDSDWRFATGHSRRIVARLEEAGAPVAFREISSPFGHDSFLLQIPDYHGAVAGFLHNVASHDPR